MLKIILALVIASFAVQAYNEGQIIEIGDVEGCLDYFCLIETVLEDNTIITPPTTQISSSSQSTGFASGRVYDLEITNLKKQTYSGGSVKARIKITNSKGLSRQREGILEWWVEDDEGKKYPSRIEKIEEGNITRDISYSLPSSIAGQASLKAKWIVPGIENIEVKADFKIIKTITILLLIAGISVTAYLVYRNKSEVVSQ